MTMQNLNEKILAAITAFNNETFNSGVGSLGAATSAATSQGGAASADKHADAVKIADWRLIETVTEREERYFVHDAMEQARSVNTTEYSLAVYVDSEEEGKKFRGEAVVSIQDGSSADEIADKLRLAAFAASKSKNPWFALPRYAEPKVALPSSGFENLPALASVAKLQDALYAPERESEQKSERPGAGARINSLELFLTRERKSFLNSQGANFSAQTWRGYSEFVLEAQADQGPVELFDDIEFSEPDVERLSSAITTRLEEVQDRAHAVPLHELSPAALRNIPVILRDKEAEELFGWFFSGATTSAAYSKTSTFQLGANVQKTDDAETVAEPLDLWAEAFLPGLPGSSAFDADGFPLERTLVIEQGILKTMVGSIRHADWLGQPRKGNFRLFSVSPGRHGLEELRAEPYLEPVMFSDFRLDPVTGDFGAEIRLAYYFDGQKRLPVTGGSISGSVPEVRTTMLRSKERAIATRSLCPVAVKLRGVSIS